MLMPVPSNFSWFLSIGKAFKNKVEHEMSFIPSYVSKAPFDISFTHLRSNTLIFILIGLPEIK